MSLLVWLRDKIYGKKDQPVQNLTVQSQITDAVTTEKVTESKPKRTAKKVTKKAPVSKKRR